MLVKAPPDAAASPSGALAHSLSLENVRKSYGGVTAVDGVSLHVPRGEFLTLLGPSGSGKTTLLMMIAGFVRPDSGDIRLDERAITDLAPERRNFGMVFQGYALFPHMTVAENVAYPLTVRGVDRASIAARVEEALALVRLEGFGQRRPRQLSGGQQQRVAIARALVFRPDLLLLDEPLGALDRKLRAELQFELKTLHARLGTTFLYVTHDQDEALSMSDRVAIVEGGQLAQVGTPDEIYERPHSRFVAEFLGTSNCISADAAGRANGLTRIEAGGRNLFHDGEIASGRVLLALRPEKITVSAEEPVDEPNRLPGRVTHAAYYGATLHATVETAELGPLAATAFAWTLRLEPGAPVWVSWRPDATVALTEKAEPEP